MKIQIKITKDILSRSRFCGTSYETFVVEHMCSTIASNCAFALAVREIAPKAIVDRGYIFWDGVKTYSPTKMRSPWTDEMSDFISQFDGMSPTERINSPEKEFETEIPDAFIESIGIEQAHAIISQSNTLELV